MSLYTSAIAQARNGITAASKPVAKVQLVQVKKVIPTPHGPVVSGEVIEGEYIPPGDYAHNVGAFGLKKLGRGLKKVAKGAAKGVKKTAKVTTKVAFTPARFALKATKVVGKGAIKVTKKTGKTVAKGSVKAVKWAKKNPVKALALAAAAPIAAPAFLAFKGAKAVAKKLSPSSAPASLGPMEETPESYPGEQYPSEEGYSETPDMLEPPAPDSAEELDSQFEEGSSEEGYSEDEGGEEYAEEGGEGEDESEYTDEGSVSGMADEWIGLEEIAGDEWVGAEEIAGDYDDVGASPVRRIVAKGKPGPNKVLVRQQGYNKARRQFLPVSSSGTVAAGASATITVAPQTLFRGRRLVVPTAIAPSFTIDDLRVGNTPQSVAAGSVPAEAFLPSAVGEDNLQMDTASPGKTITMVVTNTSGSALQFRAIIFGDSVS